jgi:lysophospholipase
VNTAGRRPAEEEGSFPTGMGTKLAYRSWLAHDPRATLLLVHGLGDHSGRYRHLALEMAGAGVSVHAFDLPGHGRSPGQRGHVFSFRELTEPVLAFRRFLQPSDPGQRPLILFGHSLGGLIALRTVQEHPEVEWDGLALSAPALGVRMPVPGWKQALGRVFSRLAPRVTLANGIDAEHLSHEPAVVRAYREDPLVHRRISARLYVEMMAAARVARETIAAVPLPPSLWLVPMDDRICDAEAALAAAAAVPGEQHRVIRYAGAYHEVMNDTVRDRMLQDLTGWLLSTVR